MMKWKRIVSAAVCVCMHGRNADNGMWKQIGFLFKEAYYPCGSFTV